MSFMYKTLNNLILLVFCHLLFIITNQIFNNCLKCFLEHLVIVKFGLNIFLLSKLTILSLLKQKTADILMKVYFEVQLKLIIIICDNEANQIFQMTTHTVLGKSNLTVCAIHPIEKLVKDTKHFFDIRCQKNAKHSKEKNIFNIFFQFNDHGII